METNIRSKKLLGTRIDKNGRKQYIYNPKFIQKQSLKKYQKIEQNHFIFKQIQKQISKDIYHKDDRIKEVAIILYLMIECGFRIGNKKYEKQNQSYGISTIKFKHINIKDGKLVIDFIGKKGVRNVSLCENKYLFKYFSEQKKKHTSPSYVFKNVTSKNVNTYLKQFHSEITSKDIRTWTANFWFIQYVMEEQKKGTSNPVKNAIERVSKKLHNSSAICKKSYIDSKIIDYISRKLKNDDIK